MKKKIFEKTAFSMKTMIRFLMNLLDSQELLEGYTQAAAFGTCVSDLWYFSPL